MTLVPLTDKEKFAFRFREEWTRKKAAVEAQGGVYGLRTVARGLADRFDVPAGLDVRTATASRLRQLQRYLKAKHMPSVSARLELAIELGCSPEVFGVATPDDERRAGEADDDPSEPSLAVDLREQVRAVTALHAETLRRLRELERTVGARQ